MNFDIKKYENEMISNLQKLLRIKSVEDFSTATDEMPYGEGPYRCLELVLNLCDKLGMRTENLDGHVGYAEVGDGKEMIACLTHLDVVPEGDLDAWIHPPYDAVIEGGKLYGRGTSDNKSPAIASIYALKAMMDSGIKLNKRIRLIFGTNEESGFGCMAHYVKVAEVPTAGFTPDAVFPIIHGEKGIIQLTLKVDRKDFPYDVLGGTAANSVPDKCILKGKYSGEWSGKSAHASTPDEGKNAISKMFIDLKEKSNDKLVVDYNKLIADTNDGSLMGADDCDDYGRLTMNIGTIQSTDDSIVFGVDIRYPISSQYEEVMRKINIGLEGSVFKIDNIFHKGPIYYELDHPLVQKLLSAYQEVTNDYESEPMTMGGGTYARAMPNLIAFGAHFPQDEPCAHQPNEFIYVKRIVQQAEIYCKAFKKLL